MAYAVECKAFKQRFLRLALPDDSCLFEEHLPLFQFGFLYHTMFWIASACTRGVIRVPLTVELQLEAQTFPFLPISGP